MERVLAEFIRRAHRHFELTLVSATVAPDLRELVDWRRVPVPRRPFPLKFATFFVIGGAMLARTKAQFIQTTGAIVPNRIDTASVHFCHAGFRARTGHVTAPGATVLRRANTALTRLLSTAAERWCYRRTRVRVLAAVSDGLAEELREHYPGVPVVVTPNGVDLDRFRPDPERRRVLRTQEGVDANQVVALFVGGDWDRKGLTVAVEGLALARKAEIPVVLWVVGKGDERRLSAFVREAGVGDAIRFFGSRQDVERFYQAADVLLLPTLYEACSLVTWEAAASGLPVVCTKVNGSAELIGCDQAGVLIERTADAVGKALVRLGSDRELRGMMGREAHRRACTRGWDSTVASVYAIYRSLAGVEDSAARAVS